MHKFPEKLTFASRRLEQQWQRITGVKMMRDGFSSRDVAEFFGVSQRVVFKWVALFSEGGQKALLAKPGAGRPPKVDAEQMRWLAWAVRNHTPNQLRFSFGLWTLRLIGQLIERELGLRLSLPTLGKLMAALGFTTQRPLYRAYEQDAKLVERWLREELPALRARAKARGAKVLFADEASMRSDYHAGTTWAPRGCTPIVRATGQRITVNMISAVSSLGELHFMLTDGRTTAPVFRQFLEQLLLGHEDLIILVVDGHPVHKAKLITEYVDSTAGRLELYFLPPYSPQLNPDEQVWKHIKASVANLCPTDKYQLRIFLRQALERLQRLPNIVRGFFAHPECGMVN